MVDKVGQEALDQLITVRDFLRWGTSQFNKAELFYGHGTDNAWDDAVTLVLHALHLEHDTGSRLLDARLTSTEKACIYELFMSRISRRIPAAYLTQEAWFAGLDFFIDERVIIPRSPIAELIENHFQPWISEDKVHHILDLCTGSGCIAIASALAFPDAEVDAVELSKEAAAVAKININHYDLNQRLKLYESDLFTKIPKSRKGSYDIIISNPPYVSKQEYESLPEEYHNEPEMALMAEDDGLAIVIKILQQAAEYLTPHGILIVEVGASQEALVGKFPLIPFLWLDFERGGEGVFMLTAQQLKDNQALFN